MHRSKMYNGLVSPPSSLVPIKLQFHTNFVTFLNIYKYGLIGSETGRQF